jgi:hypothetical protein
VRAEKNRARYRTVAFRMSEDEWHELEHRVALSGRQRQDYLIQSALYQQIAVVGNRLLGERLEQTLGDILKELVRIRGASEFDPEALAPSYKNCHRPHPKPSASVIDCTLVITHRFQEGAPETLLMNE